MAFEVERNVLSHCGTSISLYKIVGERGEYKDMEFSDSIHTYWKKRWS